MAILNLIRVTSIHKDGTNDTSKKTARTIIMHRFLLDTMVWGKLRVSKTGRARLGPWAVVDFDGVVVSSKHLTKKEGDYGQPLSLVAETLDVLNDEGYKILLYTTRKVSEGVIRWLKNHHIKFEAFLSVPPKKNPRLTDTDPGLIYFDDNTIYYDRDDVEGSLNRLRKFVHYKNSLDTKKFGMNARTINGLGLARIAKNFVIGRIAPIHITSSRPPQ